jgi:hypothetical protein
MSAAVWIDTFPPHDTHSWMLLRPLSDFSRGAHHALRQISAHLAVEMLFSTCGRIAQRTDEQNQIDHIHIGTFAVGGRRIN